MSVSEIGAQGRLVTESHAPAGVLILNNLDCTIAAGPGACPHNFDISVPIWNASLPIRNRKRKTGVVIVIAWSLLSVSSTGLVVRISPVDKGSGLGIYPDHDHWEGTNFGVLATLTIL
jgi:hypothetical protein